MSGSGVWAGEGKRFPFGVAALQHPSFNTWHAEEESGYLNPTGTAPRSPPTQLERVLGAHHHWKAVSHLNTDLEMAQVNRGGRTGNSNLQVCGRKAATEQIRSC